MGSASGFGRQDSLHQGCLGRRRAPASPADPWPPGLFFALLRATVKGVKREKAGFRESRLQHEEEEEDGWLPGAGRPRGAPGGAGAGAPGACGRNGGRGRRPAAGGPLPRRPHRPPPRAPARVGWTSIQRDGRAPGAALGRTGRPVRAPAGPDARPPPPAAPGRGCGFGANPKRKAPGGGLVLARPSSTRRGWSRVGAFYGGRPWPRPGPSFPTRFPLPAPPQPAPALPGPAPRPLVGGPATGRPYGRGPRLAARRGGLTERGTSPWLGGAAGAEAAAGGRAGPGGQGRDGGRGGAGVRGAAAAAPGVPRGERGGQVPAGECGGGRPRGPPAALPGRGD